MNRGIACLGDVARHLVRRNRTRRCLGERICFNAVFACHRYRTGAVLREHLVCGDYFRRGDCRRACRIAFERQLLRVDRACVLV